MSDKSDIIRLPSTSLRKSSRKVGIINNDIKKVIQSMQDSTLDWEDSRAHEVGVALAAIQINLPLKIVIIRTDFDNKKVRSFQVFINPEIIKLEGEIIEDFEGCLSITDVYGKVPRYSKVRVRALNFSGKEIRVKAEGFLARVFQHEIDHTKGIMFIDHIRDNEEAFYKLNDKGQLEELDYDKDIHKNSLLW